MLLHIVAMGLIALFIYTFFLVDNFYRECSVIAEIEYKKGQILAHKFMKIGVKIGMMRASNNLDVSEYQKAMSKIDDLFDEYEKLEFKSEAVKKSNAQTNREFI